MSLDLHAGPAGSEAVGPAEDLDPSRGARRAFVRACAIGAALGGIVFVWMLTRGTFTFLHQEFNADFYDEQARALMHGRWNVNDAVLGIEAFRVGGKSYMYFGPIPALFRMPFLLLVGRSLDGRLAYVSMLAAWLVAVVAVCRIHWKVRVVVRGDAPVGRVDAFMVGLFTFVVSGGSTLLFLASRGAVFHEATLWAVAFVLCALDAFMGYLTRPSRVTLGLLTLFATCAVLSRVTTGVGAVLPLLLLMAGEGARLVHLRRRVARKPARLAWLTPTGSAGRRPGILALAGATTVPVLTFAIVNAMKFGSPFSVPYASQIVTRTDPAYERVLDANGGSLFSLHLAPTTVLQYFRPDGLRLHSLFPFVGFPRFPGPTIGDPHFVLLDRVPSLPSSQPFLFLLAVGGVVAIVRARAWRADSRLRVLIAPVLAASASFVGVLFYAYVYARFLGEFVPVLAVAGAVGLQVLLAARTARPDAWWRVPAVVVLVVVAVFSVWVNFGLALAYQRLWFPYPTLGATAGYVGLQRDINAALGRAPINVEVAMDLPGGRSQPGRLVVVGDCEGLYINDGIPLLGGKPVARWRMVEHSGKAGHLSLKLAFPRRPVGTRVPIFTAGTPEDPQILYAVYQPEDRIGFVYEGTGQLDGPLRPVNQPIEFGREYSLDVDADWRREALTLTFQDQPFGTFYFYRGNDFRIGRNDLFANVEPRFPGRIRSERVTTPLCRQLLRDEQNG